MKTHQISGLPLPPASSLGAAPRWGLAPFVGAVLAGVAVRLVLVFLRPIWADEVFTLLLARRGVPDLLRALALDSGPPLHYLLTHLLLLPFPSPGGADVAVRLVSFAASLAHVPVLLAVSRRAAHPRPRLAAGLFLLVPLAVAFGAEGRAYALASLFVLLALDRALAVAAGAGPPAALALGAFSAAAGLTHYLAAAPLAGVFLAAALRGGPRARARLAATACGALAAVAPWLPVALSQPRPAMAWIASVGRGERLASVLANLGLGLEPPRAALVPAAAIGGALLLAALAAGLRRRSPFAVALAAGLGGLAALEAATGAVLLPERSAALFLPLLALLAAELSGPASTALLSLAVAALAAAVPEALRPTPAQQLAETLAPALRPGGHVVAAGLWGPELSYRLARAGLPDRVVPFPSDVARHPGWYDERRLEPGRLAAEARAAVGASPRPRFVVATPGTRAAAALVPEVEARSGRRVAATPVVEVWAVPPGPYGSSIPPSTGR